MNNIHENKNDDDLKPVERAKLVSALLAVSRPISIALTICYCSTVLSNLTLGYATKMTLNNNGFAMQPVRSSVA